MTVAVLDSEVPDLDRTTSEGPWRTALRTLRRDKVAVGSLVILVLIIVMCVLAPVYANVIAHTDPFASNVSGTTTINGVQVPVLQPSTTGLGLGVTPIGPTWDPTNYFLGADTQGRDVAARMLYGGRNTLIVGAVSTLICCAIATLIGLAAGYFGGWIDAILSRILDVLWAFPVYLLAICLSVVLLSGGLKLGPISIDSNSIWLPILIIGLIMIPYVARPIRGQVMTLREREFVSAAVGTGASDWRVILREVLPNVLPAVIVFFPLIMSINMLTESALSFLSVGVQPPQASWGTIINDGLGLLYTRPMVAIAPGIAVAITAVALNLLGDSLRDALDPKARLRGGDG